MNGPILQLQSASKQDDRKLAPKLTPNCTQIQFFLSSAKGTTKGLPVEFGLALIQGKWKIPILSKLRHGPARLSQLRRNLPEVSMRVLKMNLHEMEREGLVVRADLSGKVPYIEYTLSRSLGIAVVDLIDTLEQWSSEHAKIMGKLPSIWRSEPVRHCFRRSPAVEPR